VTELWKPGGSLPPLSMAEADQPASSDTIQQQVYAAIKDMVMAGRFLPGQAISVRTVADMLGVSGMPTREAVKRLTSEGAFQSEANRTTRIPRSGVAEVAQILELRLMLEGLATEQAAKNISLVRLDELRKLQDEIDSVTTAGDTKASLAANKQFHFALYRTAENPNLLRLIESLWLRMGPFVSLTAELLASTPEKALSMACDHHVQLIDALNARDPEGARQAIQADIFEPTQLPRYWQAVAEFSEGAK
jgi:DNA-binding GntR family transcriptional regulator